MSPVTTSQRALFDLLVALGEREKVVLYLVGGYVRDILLGHSLSDKDIDLLVDGNALHFADAVVSDLGGAVKKFPTFFTAKIERLSNFAGIEEVDLASSRTEIYLSPGKLPSVSLAPLAEDLKRRDFTINAMAISLKSLLCTLGASGIDIAALRAGVLDPFEGQHDLAAGIVRTLHPKSFLDDPTRIFRAFRYCTRIGGDLSPETREQMVYALDAGALKTISPYRIFTEIRKIFDEAAPLTILASLQEVGVFSTEPLKPLCDLEQCLAHLTKASPSYTEFLRHIFMNSSEEVRNNLARELNLGKRALADILGAST